jgi:glycerol-3-phosphate cytidylyltransferase
MQQEFTGRAICERRNIELVFNGRDHSFSSTNLRERVWQAENEKRYSDK